MRQCTLNAEIYEASSLADASGYIAALCFLNEAIPRKVSYGTRRIVN